MIENRSVPPNTVLPHIPYRDVNEAIAWLTRAFGFREQYRYGEPVAGAQMRLGSAWIMLRSATDRGRQDLTVFLEDVDGHFVRAKTAGARITEEPHETEYGEYQYGAEDPGGHHWLFSRHAHDVSPEDWGAAVSETRHRIELLARPRFCYVEIPARSVAESVSFYEEVFGWNIRQRDTARPSFDDATGNISGAWVTDRKASAEPGLLPYIWVDDIGATVARIEAHGGSVVQACAPDHPGGTSEIATFRDPAGNLLGLYQESC